jgi:hypothetical protein
MRGDSREECVRVPRVSIGGLACVCAVECDPRAIRNFDIAGVSPSTYLAAFGTGWMG